MEVLFKPAASTQSGQQESLFSLTVFQGTWFPLTVSLCHCCVVETHERFLIVEDTHIHNNKDKNLYTDISLTL